MHDWEKLERIDRNHGIIYTNNGDGLLLANKTGTFNISIYPKPFEVQNFYGIFLWFTGKVTRMLDIN